jgi:hypothetical protein
MSPSPSVLARTQLQALTLVLVVACSPDGDVVGAATDGESGSGDPQDGSAGESGSDSDGISVSGEGLSGRYHIESFTLSCSGDCSAHSEFFGPVSYCDVGDRDTDYARVEQMGMAIQLDLDEGRATGTLREDGSFEASGSATEAGGAVTLSASMEGAFTGRHEGFTAVLDYRAVGRHDGDAIDCRGQLELTGNWESDECNDEPGLCPAEYPICFQDSCNAGVDGDECWEPEHCATGFVCVDQVCRSPGGVGQACSDDTHCSAGLLCAADVCSEGNVGDACEYAEHCQSGICYDYVCSDGSPGDACWSDTDCAEDNACVGDVCTAGANGDACDSAEDCNSGICYESVCSPGANGDACSFDGDCTSEICFEDLCSAGAEGDPCTWDDECTGGLACVDDVCA